MYDLLDFMGEGVYGEVFKALNKRTGEVVALKQVKNIKRASYFWLRELRMLRTIGSLDADSSNCICLNNCFKSADGDHFMEFEMLDQNVLQFMEKRDAPFSLKELRPMAKGLLEALDSLRSVGVIHTDIKLDNIMFVDQEAKPFKVKLIDFGVAEFRKEMHIGDSIQPLAYRAPEVILGLPLSEAVDIKVFLDLLKKMLEVDPEKRITPAEALLHPFITMSHFIPALAYIANSEQLLGYKPKSSGMSDSSDDEASGNENDSIQASKEIRYEQRDVNADDGFGKLWIHKAGKTETHQRHGVTWDTTA
uniref:Protein kinase domain-containing protein n=1 Tax=Knipowitschia caucasica TaxID=637954 RepID=A0AAV2IYC1_KNICA